MGQPKPKLRGRKRPDFSERLKGNSYGTANKGKKNLFLVERNKGNTYGKGNKGNTRPDLAARNKVQLTVTCPHCSKSGSNSNMKRWHFDNCKEKIKCIHL